MLAKTITRYIFVNSMLILSFLSVFFFQNAKLDFAITFKEQKFAKISIHEISQIENSQKLVSAKYAEASFAKIRISEN